MASTPDIEVLESTSPAKITDLPEGLLEDIFKYLLPVENHKRRFDITKVENCVAVSLVSKQLYRIIRPHILSLDGTTECNIMCLEGKLLAEYTKALVRNSERVPLRVLAPTQYCVQHIAREWMRDRAWGQQSRLWVSTYGNRRRRLNERRVG
jgi:hypothetical protein